MFRFSIRELMLVTVIVSLGLGWWSAMRMLAASNTKLQKENEELTWRTKTLIRGFGDCGFNAYFNEGQELIVIENPRSEGWGPGGRIAHGYDRPIASD